MSADVSPDELVKLVSEADCQDECRENVATQLNSWVYAVCSVTFDLEVGQVIESIHPKTAHLPESAKANICYLSFPDSNSSNCNQETAFHFRVKCPGFLSDGQRSFAALAPVTLSPSSEHLFGFVHFRQQKDTKLARGYFQKSVVVLSRLPLLGLLTHIVDSVARSYFEAGEPILEAVCQHIREWPDPIPGEVLHLPWIGTVLQCRIPCRADIPQSQLSFDVKPLVVMAPNPALCSKLVQSLTTLIWPLRFASDYRPFFTIHDSDFHAITTAVPIPSVVLGVTNPFFSKALAHWPHFLRVGDASNQSAATTNARALNANGLFKKKSADTKLLDSKPGLYTQYKPFLSPDKSLLKKLMNLGSRPDSVQTTILRRHFLELTQSFMIPLERYISSLMPLKKQISPFKAAPQIKAFEFEEFFNNLNRNGPVLTSCAKGDWSGLYRRFIRSPTFEGWLQIRLKDVERQLNAIHLDVLCQADFSASVLASRRQVEIVDLVLKLKDSLRDLSTNPDAHADRRVRLTQQLAAIMKSVDDDLKNILLSNEDLKTILEQADQLNL